MRVIRTIQAALPYLHSPDVRKELDLLLEMLDSELEDVGYTMGPKIEGQLKEMDAAMNEHDESTSERRARAVEAAKLAREQGGEEVEV